MSLKTFPHTLHFSCKRILDCIEGLILLVRLFWQLCGEQTRHNGGQKRHPGLKESMGGGAPDPGPALKMGNDHESLESLMVKGWSKGQRGEGVLSSMGGVSCLHLYLQREYLMTKTWWSWGWGSRGRGEHGGQLLKTSRVPCDVPGSARPSECLKHCF